MNRKQFIKNACSMMGGSLAVLSLGSHSGAAQDEEAKPAIDPAEKFRQDWIKSLLQQLDEIADTSIRTQVMNNCGRSCARRGMTELAKSCQGDVDLLVTKLKAHLGDHIHKEGNSISLTYPECYCPLVSKIHERLSDTWCECSSGWVLEVFETAAQKPVQVKLLQSIKRGAESCVFNIEV